MADRKNEGISNWQADYDVWTFGQDTDCMPKLLNDVIIKDNIASFNWIFSIDKDDNGKEKISKYKMKALKVGGEWKIDYMEGFDFKY